LTKGDVYRVLKEDHKNIKKLFREAIQDTSKYPEARKELETHLVGEEKFLYPAMEFIDEKRVKENEREHGEAFRKMARMKNMDENSREWVNSLRELNNIIVHHMDSEEESNGLFDEAAEVLSEEAEEDILHLYKELKLEGEEEKPENL
jgi:hypothetical protein